MTTTSFLSIKCIKLKKKSSTLSDDLIYDEFVDIAGKWFVNTYKDEFLPKEKRWVQI